MGATAVRAAGALIGAAAPRSAPPRSKHGVRPHWPASMPASATQAMRPISRIDRAPWVASEAAAAAGGATATGAETAMGAAIATGIATAAAVASTFWRAWPA